MLKTLNTDDQEDEDTRQESWLMAFWKGMLIIRLLRKCFDSHLSPLHQFLEVSWLFLFFRLTQKVYFFQPIWQFITLNITCKNM